MVKLLLPRALPLIDRHAALYRAAYHGHASCVQLLLPHSDPHENGSRALVCAMGRGHKEVVALLMPHHCMKDVYNQQISEQRWAQAEDLMSHVGPDQWYAAMVAYEADDHMAGVPVISIMSMTTKACWEHQIPTPTSTRSTLRRRL